MKTKTFFGFTDNLKPMQKAKVEKLLDSVKRYNGIAMSNKEFVYKELQEAAEPQLVENYQYYKRDGELTKPKNDYRLMTADNSYWTIEKTLYDYACYLLENGYLDEQKANNFITVEHDRIEAKKQAELDRIEKERLDKETKEREKQEFDQWLNSQAESYNNTEKLALIENIFLGELGQFGRNSIRLLVLIDNFDNSACKTKIKEWLSYYNTASLKTFFHITGINLGKTDKAIQERLDSITSKDFQGMIPYIPKAKNQGKIDNEMMNTFYIMVLQPEPHFEAVTGEYIKKYGLDMFIRQVGNRYLISEAKSGILLCSSDNKTHLMDELKQFVERMSVEKINTEVNKLININGISPKYKEAEAV